MAKCWVPIIEVDSNAWKAFRASKELDWFIKYKNSTKLDLTHEEALSLARVNSANDARMLWVFNDNWVAVTFEDTYYKGRNYLLWYAKSDDFMWVFRPLFPEWPLWDEMFRMNVQDKVRDKVDTFFHIIEKWTKIESKTKYFYRFIKIIRDNEYNDMSLLLWLMPNWEDLLRNRAIFEDFFWIKIDKWNTWLNILNTISKKWWISANIADIKIIDKDVINWIPRNEWYVKYTYYNELPDEMKVRYFDKKFEISYEWWEEPLKMINWIEIEDWESIFITSDMFFSFDQENQKRLFSMVFDRYMIENPEGAFRVKKQIDKAFQNFNKNFVINSALAWVKKIFKWLTNSTFYALWLVTSNFMHWLTSLVKLNSRLHTPRYLYQESKSIAMKWNFEKFYKTWWIFEDAKDQYSSRDLIKNWYVMSWIRWLWQTAKERWEKVIDAQFFNIADTICWTYYRQNLVEEYIRYNFPHIDSIDKFNEYLHSLSKAEAQKEINELVKYVDDKMFLRYNNSEDSRRVTDLWLVVWWEWKRWAYVQDGMNLINTMWMFYRNFMVTSANNFASTIKNWWKWTTQAQVKEMYEKYFAWEITLEEIEKTIDKAFWYNQDFLNILYTCLYWYQAASLIYKSDIHHNWVNEEDTDELWLAWEMMDLYELFVFPIEAFKKTDAWLIVSELYDMMMDWVFSDLSVEDNAKYLLTSEYKAITKQFTKSQWVIKWIINLLSDRIATPEEWATMTTDEKMSRARKDFTSAVWWFWYYILDDIAVNWYDAYIPKSQTALVKELFWTREEAIKMYEKLNKENNVREITNRDAFTKWFIYNTPFLQQYNIWKIWSNQHVTEWLVSLKDKWWYRNMIKWDLPKDITDVEWLNFYTRATKNQWNELWNVRPTMLTDMNYVDDKWVLHKVYSDEAKEKIRNELMIANVDRDLFDKAVDLLSLADKSYQENALQALLYLDAQTPWAWAKLLWYVMNSKVNELVFWWDYWKFKREKNWEYSAETKAYMTAAYTDAKIKVAKKYFQYEYIADRDVWTQAILKLAKDKNTELAPYIKDTNEYWLTRLSIKNNLDSQFSSQSLYDTFLLQTYIDIASTEWYPDAYKMYNIFSRLWSESWNKDINWQLTDEWYRNMIESYNYIADHINELWVSDVEKTVMMSSLLMQSDKFLSRFLKDKTADEVENDPVIQTALQFVWWTNSKINELWNRAVYETVEKKYNPTLDDYQLSFVTKNLTTNKSWYSNWKQYYNKYHYFYDALRNMWKNYVKYKNKFYLPQNRNATQTYSEKEWKARWFWVAITNRGSSSWWWDWKSRSEWVSQEKASWYTTQRRWAARPFVNRWDLDKIPDRRYKPQNRRTTGRKIWNSVRNKLIPGRRRRIKAVKWDTASMT